MRIEAQALMGKPHATVNYVLNHHPMLLVRMRARQRYVDVWYRMTSG
ncbi:MULTISPECIES: hypothetical protein [Paenibacillus]|nr:MULTISPECIES: hypothetical protein [Paenibacillus]